MSRNCLHNDSFDNLQAGLFLLISQYTVKPCPHIAGQVVERLTMLCNHPQMAMFPNQSESYARMINFWRAQILEKSFMRGQFMLH